MRDLYPNHMPENIAIEMNGPMFNADFEVEALGIAGEDKAMPSENSFRTQTMRGHDGSYHSQNTNTARRHAAFHDIDGGRIAGDPLDRYGRRAGPLPKVFDSGRFDYWLASHYISKEHGCLIQRGWVGEKNPRAWDSSDGAEEGQPEIHTSWLQTICRYWDSKTGKSRLIEPGELITQDLGEHGSQLLHSPNATFRIGKYFEMQVNFSNMATGGHRHSWWFMPVIPNTAYDKDPRNGCEPDGYEHEVTRNKSFSLKVFMKNLAGSILGNTVNETSIDNAEDIGGDDSAPNDGWGWKDGAISLPGVNEDRWQTFGLWWGFENGVPTMRWYHDGKEYVKDSVLAPGDIELYMILSREANTHGGLSGENIYDYLDTIENDFVKVRYVRAWDASWVDESTDLGEPNRPVEVKNPVDVDNLLKLLAVAETRLYGLTDTINDLRNMITRK